MRSAKQITSTVSQWHDHGRAERERALREYRAMIAHARDTGAEWYTWIVGGKQPYTTEEYAALKGKR